ncbi:MAG: hypothetical protein M0R73_02580 [Dehalococcoidia bacterium]|nr:hypothetical protein [Dehalococcoidia bacterium]
MHNLTTEAAPRLEGAAGDLALRLLLLVDLQQQRTAVLGEVCREMAALLRECGEGDALDALDLYGYGLDYLSLHGDRVSKGLRALLGKAS